MGVRDAKTANEGAVGRSEVDDSELGTGGLIERDMPPGNEGIRKPERARRALPHEDAARAASVDRAASPGIGPFDHVELEDRSRRRDGLRTGAHDRREPVLVAATRFATPEW
jgi:hypothetical protein